MTEPIDSSDADASVAPPLLLLSLLTAFGAMSIDIILPGMPQMAADLDIKDEHIPFAIGSFLIGIGTGQIFWGWLADWKGRRPALLLGLVGYLAASLLCMAAQDGLTIFSSRALQGLCAAAPVGLARAIVRDCFDGKDAAKALATIMLVFFITPMLAPLIGAGLLTIIDWRATFGFTALFGLIGIALTYWLMPETLRQDKRRKRRLFALIEVGFAIVALKRNRGAMLAVMGLSSGLFTYISLGPLVTQDVYGYSATFYAWLFAAFAAVQMGSSFLCQAVLKRFSVDHVFSLGALLCFLGGLVCAIAVIASAQTPILLLIGLTIYMAGFGLVLPTATAKALSPFGAVAGLASAMLGAWQTVVSGSYSGLAGMAYDQTPLALGLGVFGAGCVLFVAMITNTAYENDTPQHFR